MKLQVFCKKLLSVSAFLLITTLSQVSAISLADIQSNPERFGTSSSTSEYAYYVDLPASRSIMEDDPHFAVDGQLIYVDYKKKQIRETYATMYYDRSESMEDITNNILENIKNNYTKKQLADMGKEGFNKLFAENFQNYLYEHPQISLQINGTHTYSFDGKLKKDKENQSFDALRHPTPIPFGGDSYTLALMMFEQVYKTPYFNK